MTNVTAATNLIVVDKSIATSGITTLTYEKDQREEMWERYAPGAWTPVANTDLFKRVATATADEKGNFSLGASPLPPPLKPGMTYEVGIFTEQHGPLTTDPIRKASAKVFCIWKKPDARKLITDQNRDTGGTWHWHQIHTSVPTDLAIIGLSRKPPTVDSDGIPHLMSPDGAPTKPLATGNDHQVEINPLLPGHAYFFAAVVVDVFGNWEVAQENITTKRRQLTVEFPTIHIYNDGDPNSVGEGEFWFRVYSGALNMPTLIQDFHLPTQDIDDWSETDRPYAVGFAHIGTPQVVNEPDERVAVSSWAVEHDGIFESDEGAQGDSRLSLPVGRGFEAVSNQTFLMDCPTSTVDDDFHYGVDVKWSVTYVS
jgi:hypothetical protein